MRFAQRFLHHFLVHTIECAFSGCIKHSGIYIYISLLTFGVLPGLLPQEQLRKSSQDWVEMSAHIKVQKRQSTPDAHLKVNRLAKECHIKVYGSSCRRKMQQKDGREIIMHVNFETMNVGNAMSVFIADQSGL